MNQERVYKVLLGPHMTEKAAVAAENNRVRPRAPAGMHAGSLCSSLSDPRARQRWATA